MTVGVYQIINISNNKRYIGSSNNCERRQTEHWRYLKTDTHANRHLQHAWNKYGEAAFQFEIIATCDIEYQFFTEQMFISFCGPEYNATQHATLAGAMRGNKIWLGRKHSEETKRRMSKSALGRTGPVGERNCKAKLTTSDVLEIRRLRNSGIARNIIADKFGVNPATITSITKRKTWRHV